MKTDKTAVIIVGAGPVGLILAHILGQQQVPTLILELADKLPLEPRAVGLDPESLRTLQALDMLDVLEGDLMHGMTGEYLNEAGELLFAIDDDQPGPLGYTNLASFDQPALVAKLAHQLSRYSSVELCYSHSLLDFEQSADGVVASVQLPDGTSTSIAADYLVGCDGGRSTVRRQLGIALQGESNPRPWLVIDTREEEYDGLHKYRFFCSPQRPGMFLQTPHSTRRWEWMLMPGEDRGAFLEDEQIHALLSPYIDISKIDIFRRRVYDFHAVLAEHFQQGRVFLAGDSAHMTPPFAGQGLNSGIRDVTNLGWKLAAVCQEGAPEALLDSYEPERWHHAKQLIDMAVALGDQIQPIDPEAAAARDAGFAELNKSPENKDRFVNGIFTALLDRYFKEGFALGLGGEYLAGRMISQPVVSDAGGHSSLLDHHLGNGFAIVGYNCDPEEALGETLAAQWRGRGARLVCLDDTGSGSGISLPASSHIAELFSHGSANLVLLRPDRFCMAAFDANSAEATLTKAGELLGYET
jgi:3-(3-hydroxy-phenyl)propionate hydroxylase